MKKRSLLYKLILINGIILGFVLNSLALTLAVWFRSNYFNEKREQYEQTAKYLSEVMEMYYDNKGNLNNDELKAIVNMASISIDARLFLYDKNNNIYLSSNNTEDIDISSILISSEKSELLKNNQEIEIIDNFYTYIYPFKDNNVFLGYAVMSSPLFIINKSLRKIYFILWISAIGTMFFSILILTYFAKTILINPLAEINNVAKKIANGEINKRVEIKSQDEIGELAQSFNLMADSLERVEKNRREFISNVSHELRSPITSIKGFIAGIIDGVIPKDKEDYYLKRVYSEIQRLTRLINDLLDLSAIESGKLKFIIRKFDVNELIRICIINSERKIKEKDIELNVELQGEKCYVNSDEDKTMQVVTNLLDNAIKYCEKSGNIKISTYNKGKKVFVEIYNDGPSLTEEETIHIWDRFYKSDKSRTNKVSTGLGLSIVRMILVEQGEEIYAKNDKIKGVSFIFSLSKYR